MARYSIDGQILTDIADAINEKTGGTNPMAPGAMADAISRISGGGVTVEPLSVTENGTYAESGKAYSPVTVNVPGVTHLVTTYTAASDTAKPTFPTPKTGIPLLVEIKTDEQGTDYADFAAGSVISLDMAPVSDSELGIKTAENGVCRGYATNQAAINSVMAQYASTTNLAASTYRIVKGNLEAWVRGNLLFLAGASYTIDWYYA